MRLLIEVAQLLHFNWRKLGRGRGPRNGNSQAGDLLRSQSVHTVVGAEPVKELGT